MKKSLLALAVLGAFAGAAFAQSSVTVYGVADIGLAYNKQGAGTETWSLASGNQSGSRLGFRGTEDLGGGLSAIFALENGYNLDTGAQAQGRLFGRQAWVGLKGGFGTVKFGRQYTPMFLALDSIDPFGTGLAGAITRTFSFGYTDLRTDNTINYSIDAGGFSGQIAYSLGEQAGSVSDQRQIGLSVGYANGPITAVLAHHDADDTLNTIDFRTTMLGGAYNFGVAKAHAAVAQDRLTLAGTSVTQRNYMLGVSAGFGPGTVMASYKRNDIRVAGVSDTDDIALGYTYNLSKRTNLYTSIARMDFKTTGVPNSTDFNLGIRHKF